MAPHSSTLAWKIPWTEEPGGLQSMGSRRVGHDRATSLFLSCIEEGNGNLLQCSCLENPRDGGAWWAAVYGVAQSQTRLKWLSSSSKTERSIEQEKAGASSGSQDLERQWLRAEARLFMWEAGGVGMSAPSRARQSECCFPGPEGAAWRTRSSVMLRKGLWKQWTMP